ncbi:MAG: hypothetical protein M3070_17210 [Actinomycetota bacterium]|nr:hypothetical protein [Actinomycetota bacterium]
MFLRYFASGGFEQIYVHRVSRFDTGGSISQAALLDLLFRRGRRRARKLAEDLGGSSMLRVGDGLVLGPASPVRRRLILLPLLGEMDGPIQIDRIRHAPDPIRDSRYCSLWWRAVRVCHGGAP